MPITQQINAAGRMSDDKRNETQLVCDIVGLESLVDEITHKLVSEAETAPTPTAVLGPFWRANAPNYEMGTSIVHNIPDGDHTYIHGFVKDYLTGEPIEGAVLDVWHAAPNGLYEQQDPNQVDFNLHGRFTTGRDGRYSFYCLRPTSYTIPQDGPAGELLKLLDRHPMRPGHIHFLITAPNYKSLVTQIFDRTDEHLEDDSVFAVKGSLVVDFVPRKNDPEAQFELAYDFHLAASKEGETHFLTGPTEQNRSNGAVNGSGSTSD